jgi:hypothetical protein
MVQTKVIQVPSLGDKMTDFKALFLMAKEVVSTNENIFFDFYQCNELRPNAVALLGGIARLAESKGKKACFSWDSLQDGPRAVLYQNGFAQAFGHLQTLPLQDAIPYREDRFMKPDPILDYLSDSWLSRGWVHVSRGLRDAIVGKMWEIYNNAFDHSQTSIGVFSCGEHIQDDLILTVVDFGSGIPAKVRNFLRSDPRSGQLESASCLRWAFQPGNSTCVEGIPRGLGLDLLKNFVELNRGKLEVYSNDGYVRIDEQGVRYDSQSIPFEGTVVHITLRCDKKLYRLGHEVDPEF